MHKYPHSKDYKKYNKRRAYRSLNNRIRGERNLEKKKRQNNPVPEFLKEEYRESKGLTRVRVPSDFRLLENTIDVLKFVDRMRRLYRERKPIFLNMKDVVSIDFPAELVLVALLHRFKHYNIHFKGNFPLDSQVKTHILTSDYFKHMHNKHDKISYVIGKPKQIFAKAEKKVVPKLISIIIQELSEKWNVPENHQIFKGFYRTLIELMQNTRDHASTSHNYKEWWWLSQDIQDDKANFTFLDLGRGIINSIENKRIDDSRWGKAIRFLKNTPHNPKQVLEWLIEGRLHQYTTTKYYRGKGIPGIYNTLKRGQIFNLKILTNTILADISTKKFKKLNFEFKGTLIYFEIHRPKNQ